MRVPYSWLGEFIEHLPPAEELAALCDGLGLSTEAIHRYEGATAGTVAVLLESVEPVAGSEHLRLATAFDGKRRHQVVTGAPNARRGMVTAFAAPGVELPALGVTVEAREMAGLQSSGILLSPRELGVFDHAGGLVELAAELEPGSDLARLWPGDDVLELELTPNRADAFSILGVARDLAAKLKVAYRNPAEGLDTGNPNVDDGLAIEIADPGGCPLFTLRKVDGVRVGPSPIWLQRRLASVGLRPRNNVVDVTNYVTFELGQPSHAYDAETLGGGKIQVRPAEAGERLTTLVGDELELESADLVIATPAAEGSKAIGLAGVIGGLHESVEAGTTSIALEVAHFDPLTIRRTAKRHALSTDAHYRFERGVDPALPPSASARASELMVAVAGGNVHEGVSTVGGYGRRVAMPFRPSRVEFLMDFDVPLAEQRRYLEALGCTVEEQPATDRGEDSWLVTAPTWRVDLAIEEDLVEEVGRLHGYEHVGETVPVMHFVPKSTDPTHRDISSQIAGLGFSESIAYVFSSNAELARAGAPEARVRLANPQGVERSVLRTALYPGLLAAAAFNRAATSLALFEIGRVFLEDEQERVALLARGPWQEPGWQAGRELDFYLFKGLLESLAERRNVKLEMLPHSAAHLHPGIAAEVLWDGRRVGSAGRLHPEIAARYELGDVFVAELDLPLPSGSVRYVEPPRQQHAERDVSVVAPLEVSYLQLSRVVRGSAGELLDSLEPFDVYTGVPIPEGKRSLALRLRFRHPERALRDDEIDGYMENVMSALRRDGYDIRDR
ncbi:MAG: phenylalanine--tRNA ligase subunit beta [Trueperaceae bacterium]